MAQCKTIYYTATNSGSIQLGDFLYQNAARTIPASEGWYGFNLNDKWYQTDAEGLVIETGSCPIINVVSGAFDTTSDGACYTASLCEVYSGSYSVYYSAINSSSFVPPTSSIIWEQQPGFWSPPNTVWYGWNSLAGSGVGFQSGSLVSMGVFNDNSANRQVSLLPEFTGSNSIVFRISGNNTASFFNGSTVSPISPNDGNTSPYILSMDSPFSFEVWIKPDTSVTGSNRSMSLISKKNYTDNWSGYDLTFNTGSAGKFGLTLNTSPTSSGEGIQTYQLSVVSSGSFTGSEWQQLVATYDGSRSGSGILLYRNGELVNSTISNQPHVSGSLSTQISLQIGNSDWGDIQFSNRYYIGRMGMAKIYKSKLSSNIVRNNYRYYSSSFTN